MAVYFFSVLTGAFVFVFGGYVAWRLGRDGKSWLWWKQTAWKK